MRNYYTWVIKVTYLKSSSFLFKNLINWFLSLCYKSIIFIFVFIFHMYKITREEAAGILNISTRSIDRYIRAGKLRSKKEGKIVYIHEDDINNFLWVGTKKQEVIVWNIPTREEKHTEEKMHSPAKIDENFWVIFDKLRFEIKLKDEEIKDLSVKVWKMEEIVKNSISMLEFKKNQFLLEESKNSLHSELENTKKELEHKNNSLKEEKKLNYILIITTVILFIVLVIVWMIKI